MLDVGIGAGEDLRHVTVLPAHHEGRSTIVAEYLEYLSITLRLAQVMSPDDESITRTRPQRFAR
jgi:hypothetical protein